MACSPRKSSHCTLWLVISVARFLAAMVRVGEGRQRAGFGNDLFNTCQKIAQTLHRTFGDGDAAGANKLVKSYFTELLVEGFGVFGMTTCVTDVITIRHTPDLMNFGVMLNFVNALVTISFNLAVFSVTTIAGFTSKILKLA